MKITVIGAGYVGLVSGTCFADLGNTVTCIEINTKKLNQLQLGSVPFFEPGLDTIVQRNIQACRLSFSYNLLEHLEESEIIIAAVGTPEKKDGSCDTTYLFEAAKTVFEYYQKNPCTGKIWMTKSTVSVGTAKKLIHLRNTYNLNAKNIEIVSNPEFLREGSAVHDFFHPDRIVVGSESAKAQETLNKLYRPLHLRDVPIIHTSLDTAELAKYAANAFLAAKITFINEMANLCEASNADIKDIAKIMGMDQRIGKYFLHPGPGYGGSCFPKDVKALAHIFQQHQLEGGLVEATQKANLKQKKRCADIILKTFKDQNAGKITIAIAGLSFKANTDDIRESSSLQLINDLLEKGFKIKVFDPAAQNNIKAIYKEKLLYAKNTYDAAENADALVIMTEWHAFRSLDLNRLKEKMKRAYFFDFRKIYEPEELSKAEFNFYILGRETNISNL